MSLIKLATAKLGGAASQRPFWFAWLLGCAWVFSGCQSAPVGAEGSIAWVEITNHSTASILAATKTVFEKNAFAVTVQEPDRVTFERRGNNWDQLSHGDWGGPLSERVKVYVTSRGKTNCVLHCRAYMVRQSGDPVFEDADKLTRMRRKPYQKLLDEVKQSLEAPQ